MTTRVDMPMHVVEENAASVAKRLRENGGFLIHGYGSHMGMIELLDSPQLDLGDNCIVAAKRYAASRSRNYRVRTIPKKGSIESTAEAFRIDKLLQFQIHLQSISQSGLFTPGLERVLLYVERVEFLPSALAYVIPIASKYARLHVPKTRIEAIVAYAMRDLETREAVRANILRGQDADALMSGLFN